MVGKKAKMGRCALASVCVVIKDVSRTKTLPHRRGGRSRHRQRHSKGRCARKHVDVDINNGENFDWRAPSLLHERDRVSVIRAKTTDSSQFEDDSFSTSSLRHDVVAPRLLPPKDTRLPPSQHSPREDRKVANWKVGTSFFWTSVGVLVCVWGGEHGVRGWDWRASGVAWT